MKVLEWVLVVLGTILLVRCSVRVWNGVRTTLILADVLRRQQAATCQARKERQGYDVDVARDGLFCGGPKDGEEWCASGQEPLDGEAWCLPAAIINGKLRPSNPFARYLWSAEKQTWVFDRSISLEEAGCTPLRKEAP